MAKRSGLQIGDKLVKRLVSKVQDVERNVTEEVARLEAEPSRPSRVDEPEDEVQPRPKKVKASKRDEQSPRKGRSKAAQRKAWPR